MSHGLPDFMVSYLAERDAQRAAAVDEFLASLTDYERGLFHDAAVMGYVQGLMRDRAEGVPKDSRVMALVAAECLALPDLYPTVNADFEERRTEVEYFVQCQQPDGSWVQCTSATTDGDYALQHRDLRRASMPEYVFRLAQRTTRVIVRAEPAEAPQ